MKKYNFTDRHIGVNNHDAFEMLQELGFSSIDELISQTIPDKIRLEHNISLPCPLTESRFIEHVWSIGKKNKQYRSYIGMGYFNTILPGVIQRNILENPGWYTAYTPYQAEISQGRLEALLNFQTMVAELTGMEIANASLLDEGTAAAEAMTMLFNNRKSKQKKENVNKFFVSSHCYPQTISILKTRSEPLGIELVIGDHETEKIDHCFF